MESKPHPITMARYLSHETPLIPIQMPRKISISDYVIPRINQTNSQIPEEPKSLGLQPPVKDTQILKKNNNKK